MTAKEATLFALARISGRHADLQRARSTDAICEMLRQVDEYQQRLCEVGRKFADALHAEVPLAGSASRRLLLAARRSAHGGRTVDIAKLTMVLQTDLAQQMAKAYGEACDIYHHSSDLLSATLSIQQHAESEALAALAADRDFQVGVCWSSSGFLQQLREQLAHGTLTSSMLQAVLRYATRFSSKPTPFSRFARVTTVDFASELEGESDQERFVRLVGPDQPVNRVYLNRGLFEVFWRIVEAVPSIRERLPYRINTSAVEIDGSLLFISNEGGQERLSSAKQGPVLRRLVQLLSDQPMVYARIRELLHQDVNEDRSSVVDPFLERLVGRM